MFHIVDNSSIVIKSGGIYKQTEVYVHNKQLYAKSGSGFVKLFKHLNGTSQPKTSWEDLKVGFEVTYSQTGVLEMPENVVSIGLAA